MSANYPSGISSQSQSAPWNDLTRELNVDLEIFIEDLPELGVQYGETKTFYTKDGCAFTVKEVLVEPDEDLGGVVRLNMVREFAIPGPHAGDSTQEARRAVQEQLAGIDYSIIGDVSISHTK